MVIGVGCRSFVVSCLVALLSHQFASQASAQTPTPTPSAKKKVSLELALLVDVSGSIDTSEFDTQRKGYADAFRDARVIERINQAGDIAVALVYWSSYYEQELTIPFTTVNINNVLGFANTIEATERPYYGGTDIGPAIDFAVPLFGKHYESLKQVIDVSGDGASDPYSTEQARDAALAAGIDAINGLPVTTDGDPYLLEFYQDYVIGGQDPFVVPAPTFEDFRDAAVEKIIREIGIIEECPNDPLKLLPGVCGCGVPETSQDDDKDGTVNCIDKCPSDPTKTEPGACGCGFADADLNNNKTLDCLEANFCGEKASVALKDGLTVSTSSLAKLAVQSAKELHKLVKPIEKQHGAGRAVELKRFATLSLTNVLKTEAAVRDVVLQLPHIVKSCPLSVVCASIDNKPKKAELTASVTKLKKLAQRATTRLFFVQLVELPKPGLTKEENKILQRKKVTPRRKAIKETVALLQAKIAEIPDVTETCE